MDEQLRIVLCPTTPLLSTVLRMATPQHMQGDDVVDIGDLIPPHTDEGLRLRHGGCDQRAMSSHRTIRAVNDLPRLLLGCRHAIPF